MSRPGEIADPKRGESALLLGAVGGLGVSAVLTQLALMREMLAAFSGNEMVLGIVLGNWLWLTGIGAALGRLAGARRLAARQATFAGGLILIAVMPLAQVFLVRVLRNVVFVRGAMIGLTETVAASAVVLLPYCVVSGFLLTVACSLLAEEEGASAIGRVYVADSLGSMAGGVLFSLVLVPRLDHLGMLYLPALVNLFVAGAAAFRWGSQRLAVVAVAVAMAVAGIMGLTDLDAVSTQQQYAGQKILFRGNSPYGKLVVTESAGQITFVENGLPIISTHDVEQVEEAVHFAMAQRPDARRVLLVSGGISGTAKEILKYGVDQVTYAELDPLILTAGRRFLSHNLADPRIRVVNDDGRLFIRRTDQQFDVVIVDMPDPSTSQINRFYTAEFFGEVKRVLASDGVLAFSSGRYENFVSPELARMLASAHATLRRSFRNALVVPGGRVYFLASDGPLFSDIASRLEQRHIQTQWVNRHYLDAMLTPDRMADMQRAITQTAAVNTDFSPVLYYYHLVHWMSQFKVRFGILEAALLAALGVYLCTIRPAPLVIFVSGFAASALEVVLLLAFQILYGSVYRQLGMIVTVFMAGLALGAFVANRRLGAGAGAASRKPLAVLAFAVGAFAALLPWALVALGRSGESTVAFVAGQAAIAALTFVLAALVGMEFPLASRVQFEGACVTSSRLYTADFVGACLGALLASTFLIPLLGVRALCLLTAALNVAGAAVLLWRKG